MVDLIVFTHHPNSFAPSRLVEEAGIKSLTSKIYGYEDIDLKNLPIAKYVIFREPDANKNLYDLRDAVLKHYLNLKSIILNYESYLKWSVLDKITQHQEFKNSGIPHLALLNLSNTKYPFIAKAKLGSHGTYVYKVENRQDLEQILKVHNPDDLLIQEFQTAGFDLRAIVLNGKVLGLMKRTPQANEFLSNYSQGGVVESYKDISDKVIEKIAIATAKCFQLDYCGVDLMKGNDGNWKVLEVNRACQFRGFEKATKINVAKSVLDFLSS